MVKKFGTGQYYLFYHLHICLNVVVLMCEDKCCLSHIFRCVYVMDQVICQIDIKNFYKDSLFPCLAHKVIVILRHAN